MGLDSCVCAEQTYPSPIHAARTHYKLNLFEIGLNFCQKAEAQREHLIPHTHTTHIHAMEHNN